MKVVGVPVPGRVFSDEVVAEWGRRLREAQVVGRPFCLSLGAVEEDLRVRVAVEAYRKRGEEPDADIREEVVAVVLEEMRLRRKEEKR